MISRLVPRRALPPLRPRSMPPSTRLSGKLHWVQGVGGGMHVSVPRSPRSSHNGPVPSSTPTAPTLAARANQALAGLSPGYFALVMGTGIVSIGLRMAGVELAALLLLVLAMLAAAVLVVLYAARWARHRERMRSDARNPETAFGY